jgi:amidohydrolase
MRWIEEAKERQAQMITDRRILHQMPEFGFETGETKVYVRKRLSEEGIEAQDVGTNGLAAVIGEGGKVFLLRADMDALPIPEENDLPFRSVNGNGHVCGHDMHTAMLLAAAGMLKKHEKELNGRVKIMFQPAEELGAGAKDMIQAGLLEEPHVDAAAALHVQSVMPAGRASFTRGVATSSIDTFQITIHGKGGHSSMPELAVNPLDAASYIQMLLTSTVQREVSCQNQAVIAVTQIHGGEVLNAFPDKAQLNGNIRCYSKEVQAYLFDRVTEVAEGVCRIFHAQCRIDWIRTPLLEVDSDLCDRLAPVLEEVMEAGVEESGKPLAGSEDFSYVSQHVPVFFAWVGAGFEGNYALHSPKVIFDEEVMWRGAAALAGFAEKWLDEEAQKA